jgi:hypothetical protein
MASSPKRLWLEKLLLEYEAVLIREQHRYGRSLTVVDSFLDDVAARANHHAIFYLIRPFLSDPDDELILELALSSASRRIFPWMRLWLSL